MPRVLDLSAITPVSVQQASEAFGSPIRLNLIRYFRGNPGPQRDAALALGLKTQAVSANTKILLSTGVLIKEPATDDGRSWVCRVDTGRLNELLDSLHDFTGESQLPATSNE